MGYSSRMAKPHNHTRKKGVKSKRKGPILRRILSQRPKEKEIAHNLESMSDPILTYPPVAARRTEMEFVNEVTARLQALHEDNPIKRIKVTLTAAQECDVSDHRLTFDMPKARKPAGSIKKRQPHSISRIITTFTLPIAEDVSFALACSVVTLSFEFVEEVTRYTDFRARVQQPSPCPSHRPEMPFEFLEDPSPEDIRAMVEKFVNGRKILQRSANEKAMGIAAERWHSTRRRRALAEFQLSVLMPVQKVYFAAGLGEAILRQALAPTIVRASNAKQRRGWMDRADVIHLFWEHALATNGAPPPLVKL